MAAIILLLTVRITAFCFTCLPQGGALQSCMHDLACYQGTTTRAAMQGGRVIELGATFPSFSELEDVIELYQQSKHAQLYISDSQILQGAVKRTSKIAKEAPRELVYYSLTYLCIHGGRKFKSQGAGVRPNHQTFKQGCCAKMIVRIDETLKNLKITSLNESHNHEMSEQAF